MTGGGFRLSLLAVCTLSGLPGEGWAQANPTPSRVAILGCGSLWFTRIRSDSFQVRHRTTRSCGDLQLVAGKWRLPQGVDVTVVNGGESVRLPVRMFITGSEIKSYQGDSAKRLGMRLRLYDNADPLSEHLLEWKDSGESMWRFVRSATDTVVPAVLELGGESTPRTVWLWIDPAIDSAEVPYRLQAYQPGPALSLDPAALRALAPRASDWIDDPRLFPLPVLRNVVVVGFRPEVPGITRQLIMDRLQGTVIGGRQHPSGLLDYFVRVGDSWRDSMFRHDAAPRKLDGGVIDRFGFYTTSTRQIHIAPAGVVDSTVLSAPCRAPEEGLWWRRLHLWLASPTPAESAQIRAITGGRWAGRDSDHADFTNLDIPGTRADALRLIATLERLPQVSAAFEYFGCGVRAGRGA